MEGFSADMTSVGNSAATLQPLNVCAPRQQQASGQWQADGDMRSNLTSKLAPGGMSEDWSPKTNNDEGKISRQYKARMLCVSKIQAVMEGIDAMQ